MRRFVKPDRATRGQIRPGPVRPRWSRGLVRGLLLLSVTTGMVLLFASSLGQWIPDHAALAGGPFLIPAEPRITVEVRNAGGVDGMARTATAHLRSAGFDVVDVGNASSFDQQASVVIDRVGNEEAAADVAWALGIDSVGSEPDPNLFVDVTVRLGSDWTPPRRREPLAEVPVFERLGDPDTDRGNDR